MTIQQLPSEVIEKIAAGEVVERPASLLKELVENSLDAKASTIEVEIQNGGESLRITDDGCGITASELPLAIARHATSKIRSADDLWTLTSFGFRGEALASICAVADVEIVSRRASEEAYSLKVQFGEVGLVEKVGGNRGTTITVERLFENVPARKKFLRSQAAETTQIVNTLKAMALCYPNVTFRFKKNGKIESLWPACETLNERAKIVLARPEMYSYSHETGLPGASLVKVDFSFASPSHVVKNSRQIWSFVNGRWIQDKSIQAAVMDAYRSLLMHGEYPICVVKLNYPPDGLDVNIHPLKSQVKFANPSGVYQIISRGLRAGLEKAPWLDNLRQKPFAESRLSTKPSISTKGDLFDSVGGVAEVSKSQSSFNEPISASEMRLFDSPEFERIQFKKKPEGESHFFAREMSTDSVEESDASVVGKATWSKLDLIGQANLTYIVAQSGDRVVLVDQHAAHERVIYEKLMSAYRGGSIEIQNLLIPLSLDLKDGEIGGVFSVSDDLLKFGISIEQGGPNNLLITAKPSLIKEEAIVKALAELADEMNEHGGSVAFEKYLSHVLATMACHGSIRAGQALSREQMHSLLVEMETFAFSSYCPHGRPVSIEWPFSKIEREFGRVV